MEAVSAGEPRRFDHLREHSIGLPEVLFQSITHMAPAAAVAYSIHISVPDARQALPLSVVLALIACSAPRRDRPACEALPVGRRPLHVRRPLLGPRRGFLVAWSFIVFEPLVAPFLFLEFGWAIRRRPERDRVGTSAGSGGSVPS